MTKIKSSIFVCTKCGHKVTKWIGKCPICNTWNSFIEDDLTKNVLPKPITSIISSETLRISTNNEELDRVLGGGLMTGSVVLIAGEPGVGKSSLALKVSADICKMNRSVLYFSGEESLTQLYNRAERIKALEDNLMVTTQSKIEDLIDSINTINPSLLVVDSIQTLYNQNASGSIGSPNQMRECAGVLIDYAKSNGLTILIIGHITKDGNVAGPKILEHLVDTVLFFEGENNSNLRLIRSIKNRFGASNEIGILEMSERGLQAATEATKCLFSEQRDTVGNVVIPTTAGSRPILIELQALVTPRSSQNPKRISDTIETKRLDLIVAILEKRIHLGLGACDIFLKTTGGIKLTEASNDLGICVCLASSYANREILNQSVILGEVRLSGEIQGVNRIRSRLIEAARLGFEQAIVPNQNLLEIREIGDQIKIIGVSNLSEALKAAMPRVK